MCALVSGPGTPPASHDPWAAKTSRKVRSTLVAWACRSPWTSGPSQHLVSTGEFGKAQMDAVMAEEESHMANIMKIKWMWDNVAFSPCLQQRWKASMSRALANCSPFLPAKCDLWHDATQHLEDLAVQWTSLVVFLRFGLSQGILDPLTFERMSFNTLPVLQQVLCLDCKRGFQTSLEQYTKVWFVVRLQYVWWGDLMHPRLPSITLPNSRGQPASEGHKLSSFPIQGTAASCVLGMAHVGS